MADIAELLALWQNPTRASAGVKKVASAHLAELDHKIEDLRSMRETLSHLIRCCDGDQRLECPILQDLEGPAGAEPARASRRG